jgi:hypothetical protein
MKPLIALLALAVCLSFAPVSVTAGKDDTCVSCHEKEVSGPFNKNELRDSVHRDLTCTQCHTDVSSAPHKKVGVKRVDCGSCHANQGRLFERSVHGAAFKRGDKDAPSCTTCHGKHRILRGSDQRSPVFRQNLVLVCARCHTDAEVQKKHHLPSPDVIKAYDASVHGRVVKEGKAVRAAVCTDCHGNHLILGPDQPESRTNKLNIPDVCGRCHVQIYNEYKVSIHGRALKEGKRESPGCTDCHGEHTLTLVKDPKAQVYAKNIPVTCARCHENQEIIRKYHLPSDRYSSYIGSFHGVSMKYGNITAANCTSCHEVHRILPANEPESSISSQNVARTCGKCHPSMKQAASIGTVHVEARKESSVGMYYVRRFYWWFIGVLMALFVAYIGLDVYGRIRRRRNGRG